MKKKLIICLSVCLILSYFAENSSILGFDTFKPSVTIAMNTSNQQIITWDRLPYPAYYEVEVLSQVPKDDQEASPATECIAKYHTWSNKLVVDQNLPANAYWRISARGVFKKPLGMYSNPIILLKGFKETLTAPVAASQQIKPFPESSYPSNAPAPDKPFLTWTVVPGAVFYELEVLDQPPEIPNKTIPSIHRLFSSRQIFVSGCNPDLSQLGQTHLYWRVLALDYDGNPIGVFSDAAEIFINKDLHPVVKPPIVSQLNDDGHPTPLYPVYVWIPIAGASSYEVELCSEPPENPNGITPSCHRIWSTKATGFDCYDENPRITPGTYYYRVRGLDANGNPVGVYSDAAQFVVDWKKGNYAATLGDSITHGGGAISYSPASEEYDYQTYLNFPVVNLGLSGDTSAATAQRFDRDVLPFHPQYLLILAGTNSLRSGVPSDQVISELTAIRDKCLANNIRPIFLTLPPINPKAIERAFNQHTTANWRENFDTVNRFIRQQPYVIDLEPYLSDNDRQLPARYGIDGLHPDIEGKKIMAQVINANWYQVTH